MAGPSRTVKPEANLDDPNFKKEDEFKLQDDLSGGQEKHMIPVYNYFNFAKIDKFFNYTTMCRRRPEHQDKEKCCNCKPGECNTPKCSCWANSTIRLQDRKIKNLKEVVLDPMRWMLVECRDDCGCQRKCDNWLTQEQVQLRTEIDYFDGKGFGVRIKDFVAKGEYFGEYTGEIIEDDERENVTYQFAIEEGPGRKHKSFIDARVYGNVTRFMNHSCHSCLSPFLFVRGKDNSRQYPQLGFVFTRPIAAGNEITIDYARGYWENADYDCNCGTFTCLKPSSTTRYRTKVSSNRIKNCQTLEENINLQVVKEAKLCEKRLKLLREGKSVEEVKRLLPSRSFPKKPAKITPYTIFDRCSSPLKPPEIVCLDTDSEPES